MLLGWVPMDQGHLGMPTSKARVARRQGGIPKGQVRGCENLGSRWSGPPQFIWEEPGCLHTQAQL